MRRNTKRGVEAELARIGRALVILRCIRFAALHDNESGTDLAEAITVPLDIIEHAADRLDALTTAA